MTDSAHGRTEWPELLGVDIDEAVQKLRAAEPKLNVIPVESGSVVTANYRTDRVWLWFDKETRSVAHTPRIG
jgi:hypothetical protein